MNIKFLKQLIQTSYYRQIVLRVEHDSTLNINALNSTENELGKISNHIQQEANLKAVEIDKLMANQLEKITRFIILKYGALTPLKENTTLTDSHLFESIVEFHYLQHNSSALLSFLGRPQLFEKELSRVTYYKGLKIAYAASLKSNVPLPQRQHPYTFEALVAFTKNEEARDVIDRFYIYTENNIEKTVDPKMICSLEDYPEIDDNDQESNTAFALKLNRYAAGQLFNDVIQNLVYQKPTFTLKDAMAALDYYLEMDTYKDF